MKKVLAFSLAVLLIACLCACGDTADNNGVTTTTKGSTTTTTAAAADDFVAPANYASVITVTINPQFRLYLDAAGAVLAVEPVNADAKSVAADVTVKAGDVKTVMGSLVTAVDKGGFVQENATVEIAVTEVADAAVDTAAVLETVKAAAEVSFIAVTVPVVIETTVATMAPTAPTQGNAATPDVGDNGNNDAGDNSANTDPTTAVTTKATTAATTTNTGFSSFKKYDWQLRVIQNDGGNQFCKTYTIMLTDGNLRIGEASASPYEEMVPPEYRDQEPPSFSFNGIDWLDGAGGYIPLKSAKESGNTLTLTDEDGKTLVLTRMSETTAKVSSNTIDIAVKKNDVFLTVNKNATATTTKPTTTTTTARPDYVPVANMNGSWTGGYVAEDGTYRLITLELVGDKPSFDIAIGDPLSSLPPDAQAEMKPDCEKIGDEYYYFGRGDGGSLKTVSAYGEYGDGVMIQDQGGKLSLYRTGSTELTVGAYAGTDYSPLYSIPMHVKFTFAAN